MIKKMSVCLIWKEIEVLEIAHTSSRSRISHRGWLVPWGARINEAWPKDVVI